MKKGCDMNELEEIEKTVETITPLLIDLAKFMDSLNGDARNRAAQHLHSLIKLINHEVWKRRMDLVHPPKGRKNHAWLKD